MSPFVDVMKQAYVVSDPAARRAWTRRGLQYNVDMADDPLDAFDKIADDIRRKQDELDAADKLRSAKAEEQKRKPDDAIDSIKPPKVD